jgi:hypothetical protein
MGALPADAIEGNTMSLYQGSLEGSADLKDDSGWDLSISPSYARERDGYSIHGPGAMIDVEYGDYGMLHCLSNEGWRDVHEGGNVEVISLLEAADDLEWPRQGAT